MASGGTLSGSYNASTGRLSFTMYFPYSLNSYSRIGLGTRNFSDDITSYSYSLWSTTVSGSGTTYSGSVYLDLEAGESQTLYMYGVTPAGYYKNYDHETYYGPTPVQKTTVYLRPSTGVSSFWVEYDGKYAYIDSQTSIKVESYVTISDVTSQSGYGAPYTLYYNLSGQTWTTANSKSFTYSTDVTSLSYTRYLQVASSVSSYTVTCNYYKTGTTTKVATSSSYTVNAGNYFYPDDYWKSVSGYRANYSSPSSAFQVNSNRTVSYYYDEIPQYTLTVKYLRESDSASIRTADTYSVSDGEYIDPSDYTVSISGYTLDYTSPASGFYISSNRTITCYYYERYLLNAYWYNTDTSTTLHSAPYRKTTSWQPADAYAKQDDYTPPSTSVYDTRAFTSGNPATVYFYYKNRPQMEEFAWTSNDSAYIVAGNSPSQIIKASAWNNLRSKLQTLLAWKGDTNHTPTVYAGNTMKASEYNGGQTDISTLATQCGTTQPPSQVSAGQAQTTSHFIGLKNALNQIIRAYNSR